MVYAATLTRAGQITVPKPVREALGAEPGQKIIFNVKKKSVSVERQKTAAEIAEEIDKLIPDDARAHHMKNYAGMTSVEMQEKWLETPDAAKYFQEEMERTL